MNETIKKADNETLWALLADVTQLMETRGYKPDRSNAAFMYWYEQFKAIETEINGRMLTDYMN